MNVSLTPELEKFVKDKVKGGMYASASEVVREGLRWLEVRDKTQAEKLADLREAIAEADRDFEEGRYVELDDEGLREFFEDIKRRGRERLAQRREKGEA